MYVYYILRDLLNIDTAEASSHEAISVTQSRSFASPVEQLATHRVERGRRNIGHLGPVGPRVFHNGSLMDTQAERGESCSSGSMY